MWDAIKRFLLSEPVDAPAKVPETWEVRNEEECQRLGHGHRWSQHAHDANIWHLQGCADGSVLVSAAYKGQVRVWDAQDGRFRAELQLPQTPHALAIAPDASRVVFSTVGDTALTLWEPDTNLCTRLPLLCEGTAVQMVFQSSSEMLVLIRRPEPGEENVSFWQYKHTVVAKYNIEQGQSEILFETATSLGSAAALLTPDGRVLAWTVTDPGHADAIQLAALPEGALRERFSLPDARPSASIHLKQFSADGKRLLIYAQDDSGFDHRNEVGDNFSQFVFWNMDAGAKLLTLEYETLRNVITYACTADPNVYVGVTEKLEFNSYESVRRIRDMQASEDKGRIEAPPFFSLDGARCAYATNSGNVHVFDLAAGGVLHDSAMRLS